MKVIKCMNCGSKFRYKERERLSGLRAEGPHPGYRGESAYYSRPDEQSSIDCPNCDKPIKI